MKLCFYYVLPGDQEIQPIHPQINNTEPDNARTWSATSVVQATAMRERHGDILRCLAYHESYTAKSVPVEARLDVKCEYKYSGYGGKKKSTARRSVRLVHGEMA